MHNLDVGGLERVVISLIDHMDRDQYRPVLVCLQDGGELLPELRTRGLKVFGLRKGDRFNAGALGTLTAILRREEAGIVHCHNHGALSYGVLASLLAGRGRVIYTAHGVRSARRLGSLLFGLGRRRVCRVAAVSADVLRVTIEHGRIDPQRAHLIINGIDPGRFEHRDLRDATRGTLRIDAGAFVFGIVARLTPVKDHDTLLRAFALIHRARTDAHLLIVGGGESEPVIRALAADLGLTNSVTFTGDRRDVPALLSAMDAFVLSSYTEGLSITILEAMAASLPVIATRVGGNPEIVVEAQTGLLVEPRDPRALASAMTRLLDHRADLGALGAAGRARVEEQFGERAMVKQYEHLYRLVLDGE